MRWLLMSVLAAGLFLGGCQSAVMVKGRELVVKADELATQNEAIVEKLVLDREAVTDDEEVTAIYNARALKLVTGTLSAVLKSEEE